VQQWLIESGFQWTSYDQRIPNICHIKERPDFLFDYGYYAVVLELDEHQHWNRDCECEQLRMMNIAETLGASSRFLAGASLLRASPSKGRHDCGDDWHHIATGEVCCCSPEHLSAPVVAVARCQETL
jgi:hypothetical protein